MEVLSPTKQLTLPVQLKHDATFDNFYGEANLKAASLLKYAIETHSETLVYLSGPNGAGKSHLMCAAISLVEHLNKPDARLKDEDAQFESERSICYFSLDEICTSFEEENKIIEFFSSLEIYKFLVLDNIDIWLESDKKQRAIKERCLFNLFNNFKISGHQLILSAKVVPSRLNILLPDLFSRIQSGLLLRLHALCDEQKEVLLQVIAKQKGLFLEDGVTAYILKRSGRNLNDLLSVLEKLDHASLTEKRKITIPFTKKIFNW